MGHAVRLVGCRVGVGRLHAQADFQLQFVALGQHHAGALGARHIGHDFEQACHQRVLVHMAADGLHGTQNGQRVHGVQPVQVGGRIAGGAHSAWRCSTCGRRCQQLQLLQHPALQQHGLHAVVALRGLFQAGQGMHAGGLSTAIDCGAAIRLLLQQPQAQAFQAKALFQHKAALLGHARRLQHASGHIAGLAAQAGALGAQQQNLVLYVVGCALVGDLAQKVLALLQQRQQFAVPRTLGQGGQAGGGDAAPEAHRHMHAKRR